MLATYAECQGHKSFFAGKGRGRRTGVGNEDGLAVVDMVFGVGMGIEDIATRWVHGHERNLFTRPGALGFWRSANHHILSKR